MIDRYAPKELRELWSDQKRLALWLQVELAVCDARAALGEISEADIAALRRATPPKAERVAELEAEQGHDLAAFVSGVQEQLGREGSWLHLGMTSQDVVDTALALQLRAASRIILADVDRLLELLGRLAQRHRGTVMPGRTHGMHAEPVTFGFVLANHWDELGRSCKRFRSAAAEVEVGKLSGAVGTHATISPEVEVRALAELELEPAAITTQVVARDRHASYLCSLALLGAVCERLATTLRHLQRTEVGEVREPFSERQKGSSAMPHKRNPVRLEQVSGLSRLLRGWAVAGMEDVALWHERDISHSSVERVALPDATMATAHILRTLAQVLDGLVVDEAAMRSNLQRRGQLSQSQQVLLTLVRKGMPREEAYRLVQSLALSADREGGDFKTAVGESPEVRAQLDLAELDACFKLGPYLADVDESFRRLGLLEPAKLQPSANRVQ
ncbi:MAG TPA: adenylosuccinate lyase [Candidatus Saccharimonadales bacterium]|nr:adenylosuccinate lyase [Candidatus Saccharimonadales bacterium]